MLGIMNVKLNGTEEELAAVDNLVHRYMDGCFSGLPKEAGAEDLKHVPARPNEDESIAEAVKRMEILGFKPDVVENFKKDRAISHIMDDGQFVPLEDSDLQQIQKLKEKGFVVYAAIRSHTVEGQMTSYITVSNRGKDWASERANLKYNALKAYVYNHDMPSDTEAGIIIFMHYNNNSLIRIY